MRRKATVKDVAEKAGVSVATVSRWLHSNGYVSEYNAARISDAVQQLGYQGKQNIQAVSDKKLRLIAVIGGSQGPEHTYLPRLSHALSIAANEMGYYTMYIARQPNNQNLQEIIRAALEEQVCGVIISNFEDLTITPQNKQFLANCGVSVVITERAVCAELNSVHIDTILGVYMATKHLIETGRKKLLYLTRSIEGSVESDRLKGFQKAVNEHPDEGLEYEIQISKTMQREDCIDALEKLYQGSFLPDGIVCWSDVFAITTMQFLYRRGIRVPEEVGVVGYDDFLANYSTIPLTSVRSPLTELAREAVGMIVNSQNSNGEFFARTTIVTPKLIIRESTAAVQNAAALRDVSAPNA